MNMYSPHVGIAACLYQIALKSGLVNMDSVSAQRIRLGCEPPIHSLKETTPYCGKRNTAQAGKHKSNALELSFPLAWPHTLYHMKELFGKMEEAILPIAEFKGCRVVFLPAPCVIEVYLPDTPHSALAGETLPEGSRIVRGIVFQDIYCVFYRDKEGKIKRNLQAGATALFGCDEMKMEMTAQEAQTRLDDLVAGKQAELFGPGAKYEGIDEEEDGLDFSFSYRGRFYVFGTFFLEVEQDQGENDQGKGEA